MTFTHHSVIKCEDCGERHYPGNREGCIEILKAQIDELQTAEQDRDRYQALVGKYQAALRRISHCKIIVGSVERTLQEAIGLANEALEGEE